MHVGRQFPSTLDHDQVGEAVGCNVHDDHREAPADHLLEVIGLGR